MILIFITATLPVIASSLLFIEKSHKMRGRGSQSYSLVLNVYNMKFELPATFKKVSSNRVLATLNALINNAMHIFSQDRSSRIVQ